MPERDRPESRPFVALSVVIPLAPGDDSWKALLPDLSTLPGAEVLFVATDALSQADRGTIDTVLPPGSWEWRVAARGRARQLNAGAINANRDILWFLHADSRFTDDTASALLTALRVAPDALHFFDLAFLRDGPPAMKLNALGARIRSRFLGMPFGDQGLAIPNSTFHLLGRFDERASYGEDHLFVWEARRAGIALRATGGTLRTSARRYRDGGWARTTGRHVWRTARQAFPEWIALVRQRARRALAGHDGREP